MEAARAAIFAYLSALVEDEGAVEAASDPVLIDGDERTTVRIFTPHKEQKP